jgi:hypothetical protein
MSAVGWAQPILYLSSDSIMGQSIVDSTHQITEVEVTRQLKSNNILSGSSGLQIDMKTIKLLPNVIGESDPYKALQFLGGVSPSGEANSGLYVRGGNNDHNLILLNGALVQNPTHVLGMFSIFNPDIVEGMRFIKSGIPAEYGGRLSSVVDISSVNNITEKTSFAGSIGLISSRLAIKAPLNNKILAYASLRGSYINTLVLPALGLLGIDSTLTRNKYGFIDANAGLVYQVSNKTKVSAHLYYGFDNILIKELFSHNFSDNALFWNNKNASIKLNHLYNMRWYTNHHISYSGFNIESKIDWGNSLINMKSGIANLNYKADFGYTNENHHVKFGAEALYNIAKPQLVDTDSLFPVQIYDENNTMHTAQFALFARDEFSVGPVLFNVGIRGNAQLHLGPYTDYMETEQKDYADREVVKTYYGLEPRFFSRYLFPDRTSSVKTSISRHIQYINQIPVLPVGIPLDLQLPAGKYIKPQASWHFSSGYFKNFSNNQYESSIEVYYKTLENQLEMNKGFTGAFNNQMIEKNLLSGKGWAYGMELRFGKNSGNFKGWLTYNLAWSYRQFEELNKGMLFLARNDRRHDLSVVANYKLNNKWSFNALFVYATGNRLNLPLSWFILDNKVILEYGKYNAFEMPPFHRMDLSANRKLKPFKGINSEINFSVYNIYNRANPFQVFYGTSKFYSDNNYNFKIGMSHLLPILPTVSWTFQFN